MAGSEIKTEMLLLLKFQLERGLDENVPTLRKAKFFFFLNQLSKRGMKYLARLHQTERIFYRRPTCMAARI
jgi:hypothetical protein